jgi:2-polyprenyl-3-methyl-5-hydroxy-6-metoxy-1,4-benzoquinol methylase
MGLRLDKSTGMWPRGRRGVAVSVCRCKNCGLVFSDPLPVPRSIADHYGIPPESYWRNVRLEPDPGYFADEIAAAKRLLDFTPGMKAIDIGVGLGKAVLAMRDAGFDVCGIEPSAPFHSKALELLGMDAERIKLGSVEDADFEEGAFDFVTFGAVLEHLYDPAATLAKAAAWLKPGGVLHAEVPNSNHLISKILNFYYRAIGTTYVTNLSPMHVPFHLFEFTVDSFRKHGELANYLVEEYKVDVCSIYNMPRLLHPLLRRLMERNGTGMQLTVWLRKPSR